MALQLSQAFTTCQPPMREVSQPDFSGELLRLDLASLPDRLDDLTLTKLARLANCPLPLPARCPEHVLMEVMTTLQACLPSQQRNAISAEVQAEAYNQALGRYSLAAIKHLQAQALSTCEWFPTIAECLRILDTFSGDGHLPSKQACVRRRVLDERQARMDAALARLAAGDVTQADIDAMPEQWRSIAETRSLLWRGENGTYTLRERQN